MNKWAKILLSLVVAWVAIFAIFHWFQIPHSTDFRPEPKKLSAASRQLLETSDHFILLSLEPAFPSDPRTETPDKREKFHDCPILGSLEIKDPKQKTKLLAALFKGIKDSDGNVANCFNPRHGIKATSGTNWIELVICFQCLGMAEYGTTGGDGATTTKSPNEAFNLALREAGVPITTK